ncbi:MAG: hypothetical protein HQL74_06930 [Magnetococcales bacterium]|nr:hypothetical protein [Magnetococcales bacterium]
MSLLLSSLKNLDLRKRLSQTQSTPQPSIDVDETIRLDGEVDFKKEAIVIGERLHNQNNRKTIFRLTLLLVLILGAVFIGGKPLFYKFSNTMEPIVGKIGLLASALGLIPPPAGVEMPSVKPATPVLPEPTAEAQSSQVAIHKETGAQELPAPENTNLLLDKKLDFLLPPEPVDKHQTPAKAKPDAHAPPGEQAQAPTKASPPATQAAQGVAAAPATRERTRPAANPESNTHAERKKKTERNAAAPQPVQNAAQALPPVPPTQEVQTPAPPLELTEVKTQQHLQSIQALEQARQALASGDIFRADSSLAKVDALMRDREDYLATLAALEHRRGAHHRALGIYQRLLLRDPSRSQWLLGLALAQDRLGQGGEALGTYRKTIAGHQLTGEALGFVLGRIDFLTRQAAQQ